MKCPRCKRPDSKVVDSRQRGAVRIRRRRCPKCDYRFSTTETLSRGGDMPLLAPMVMKSDGNLSHFSRKKFYDSIAAAASKSLGDGSAIDDFVHKVEQELSLAEDNITSAELGERAMEWLRHSDPAGHVRYASVHRGLATLEQMKQLIADTLKRGDNGNGGDIAKPPKTAGAKNEAIKPHAGGGNEH